MGISIRLKTPVLRTVLTIFSGKIVKEQSIHGSNGTFLVVPLHSTLPAGYPINLSNLWRKKVKPIEFLQEDNGSLSATRLAFWYGFSEFLLLGYT